MTTCTFCQIARGEVPASIVYSDEIVIGLMALHPANPGHVLVIPKEHVTTIHDAPKLATHIFLIGTRLSHVLCDILASNSYTYLLHEGDNFHRETPHVHLHIIPRQINDQVQLDRRASEAPRDELDRIGQQLRQAYQLYWSTMK